MFFYVREILVLFNKRDFLSRTFLRPTKLYLSLLLEMRKFMAFELGIPFVLKYYILFLRNIQIFDFVFHIVLVTLKVY